MKHLILCAAMLLATPLAAQRPIPAAKSHGHRILTAVPRAVGRGLVNQLTCRNVSACIDEWASWGATMFDAYSTNEALRHEPGARELNPLMFGRPSPARVVVTMNVISLLQNAVIQFIHEGCDKDNPCHGLDHLQAGAFAGLHVWAGAYNLSTIKR